MTSDPQHGSPLKPVKPARVAEEITKLSAQRRSGEVAPEVYDQKFARMIQELRERRIEGSRADITGALEPLVKNGTITAAEYQRLTKQLGIQ